MSLTDTITRPLRSRKPADEHLSPVAAALARPVPTGLKAAEQAVIDAKERHGKAVAALHEARSFSARKVRDEALGAARKALSDADVAVELGDPDAPNAAELAKLQSSYDRAKTDVDNAGARIESLIQFEERSFLDWDKAHTQLNDLINTWKKPLLEAVDQQLQEAMQIAAEAVTAAKAARTWEPLTSYPSEVSMRGYTTPDKIKGDAQVHLPTDVAAAVYASTRHTPTSRPAVAIGTEIRGIWDKR